MARLTEIREDLFELKDLRRVAKRNCSQQLLDDQIKKTSEELEKLLAAETDKDRLDGANGEDVKEQQPKVYTVTLRTYSWDQSDKFMKLYVTIPGLLPSDGDKVKCTFSHTGVTLNVTQLQDKNYQLVINNLAKAIAQEKSHWKTKDGMVVIFLSKERIGVQWPAVTEQEAKIKEKNKPDIENKSDPNGSIMGLMKKMYDDGDDNMKQMLNKTWYETQMKTGGGSPGGGDMGGMGGLGGMGDLGGMGGLGGMGDLGGMGGLGNMPDLNI